MIEQSPPPAEHRKVPGVDTLLAEIVDRCLAADPDERFPNVQSVLDALEQPRDAPCPAADDGSGGDRSGVAVGGGGLVCLAGIPRGLAGIERGLDRPGVGKLAICRAIWRQRGGQRIGTPLSARGAGGRFRSVSRSGLKTPWPSPSLKILVTQLNDPKLSDEERESLREQFRDNPDRKAIATHF